LTLRDAMIFGKKYAAKEALALRLVDVVTSESQVLTKSLELAASLASKGEDKVTLKMIKSELYKSTLNTLLSGGLGESEKHMASLLKSNL
jgi:enoyl-CoA hydratase/carnithine racemase